MIAEEMLYFREILADRGIQFCYCGYITEDILSGIGSSLKQKLAMENTNREVARAVFSLFVEQVQNVIRYSAEKKLSAADSGLSDVEFRFIHVLDLDEISPQSFHISSGYHVTTGYKIVIILLSN